MAKFAADQIMDAALDNVINNADSLVVCEGQPTNYSEATTSATSSASDTNLGTQSIGTGDFTKADGDTSGRKVTVAAQSGVDVDTGGDADHVAIVDDTNSTLLLVTTQPSTSVTTDGTMSTDAFDEEIEDPA